MSIDPDCVEKRAFAEAVWHWHRGKEDLHGRSREVDPISNHYAKQGFRLHYPHDDE